MLRRPTKIFLLFLSISFVLFNIRNPIACGDSSYANITNAQAINSSGQPGLFYVRGSDAVGFNITIANSGVSTLLGTIIVTIQDVNGIPIQLLTQQNFSVQAGGTNSVILYGDKIPSYAYVGIATAQVNFFGSQNTALCPPKIAKFYISLTSNPSNPFAAILPSLPASSVTAGSSISCNVTAYNAGGNSIDITKFVNWSISIDADGFWVANTYTSAKVGTWNITATLGNQSCMTPLVVSHGSAIAIAVFPQKIVVTAGQSQPFTVLANDAYDNSWDVTNSTALAIDSAASGNWSGSVYTSAAVGVWQVNGTFGSLMNFTEITVKHGQPVSLSISPKSVSLNAGSSQPFTTLATDFFGNNWEATNTSTFIIDSAAEGSWAVNNYTSGKIGNWIITAIYNNVTDFSNLTVYNTVDLNRDSRVNFEDIQYLVSAYGFYARTSILDVRCDINHDGLLNFNDIALFVSYYIAYSTA